MRFHSSASCSLFLISSLLDTNTLQDFLRLHVFFILRDLRILLSRYLLSYRFSFSTLREQGTGHAYQELSQVLHSGSETICDVLDELLVLFQHQSLHKPVSYSDFLSQNNETARTAFLMSQASAPSATNLSSLIFWSTSSFSYVWCSLNSLYRETYSGKDP